MARHVLGLRAAAFLTAGIARVPFWKFVLADAGAALIGVPLGFGLAYFFTDRIKAILADVHRAERWLGLAGLLVLAVVLVVVIWRWNHRVATAYLPARHRQDFPQVASSVVTLGSSTKQPCGSAQTARGSTPRVTTGGLRQAGYS